jgi:hypothetical protein
MDTVASAFASSTLWIAFAIVMCHDYCAELRFGRKPGMLRSTPSTADP